MLHFILDDSNLAEMQSFFRQISQRPLCLLAAVILYQTLLTIPWLGLKPFYSRGEPREALVAQAMINSGDWILPQRYGDDIATKPPMTHWLMAAAAQPLGEMREAAARLPSALGGVIVIAAFFWFC